MTARLSKVFWLRWQMRDFDDAVELRLKRTLQAMSLAKSLIQTFFMHPKQVALVERFVAGFVLIVDGTFNTNSLRSPLLIAVGITNSGKTFPVAFSYCPSESKESFDFFLLSLKEEAFAGDI